jgi:hypothetical protein
MKNFYIKRIERETKKESFFIGYIQLGKFGFAENWSNELTLLSGKEAEKAFFQLTNDMDNINNYSFSLLVNN